MKTFQDSKKRKWEIAVNALTVFRVQDALHYHLPGLLASGLEAYVEFLGDDAKRAKTLYILVQPQAEKEGVSEEDFLMALDGDALEDGTMALQEEIINFFPRQKREALRKALKKAEQVGEMMTAKGVEKLESIDWQAEVNGAAKRLEEKSTTSFGDVRELSVSSPGPSP